MIVFGFFFLKNLFVKINLLSFGDEFIIPNPVHMVFRNENENEN